MIPHARQQPKAANASARRGLSVPSMYQPAVHRMVSTITSPQVISANASAGSSALNNHGRRAARSSSCCSVGVSPRLTGEGL